MDIAEKDMPPIQTLLRNFCLPTYSFYFYRLPAAGQQTVGLVFLKETNNSLLFCLFATCQCIFYPNFDCQTTVTISNVFDSIIKRMHNREENMIWVNKYSANMLFYMDWRHVLFSWSMQSLIQPQAIIAEQLHRNKYPWNFAQRLLNNVPQM